MRTVNWLLCVCVCAFNFEPVSLCLHCLLQSSLMKWPGAERKKCSTIQIMWPQVRTFYLEPYYCIVWWLHYLLLCNLSITVITEGKSQEELEAEEQEEEEEAKNIQKRLAANLSEEDYDLNFFQVFISLVGLMTCWQKRLILIVRLCLNEGICCGEGWKQACGKRGEDCERSEADVSEGKNEAFEERVTRAAWAYSGLQGKGKRPIGRTQLQT